MRVAALACAAALRGIRLALEAGLEEKIEESG